MTPLARSLRCALTALAFALCLLPRSEAMADSPLTSADFAIAYQDVPEIGRLSEHAFDERAAKHLIDPAVPNDVRAAIINAIGWQVSGQKNAAMLLDIIAREHGKPVAQITVADLAAHELFALGYMRAMDDYHDLSPIGSPGLVGKLSPQDLIAAARSKAPKDSAISVIAALVDAQAAMDGHWCTVFTSVNTAVGNPPGIAPLRREAIEVIMEYIKLYESSCIK